MNHNNRSSFHTNEPNEPNEPRARVHARPWRVQPQHWRVQPQLRPVVQATEESMYVRQVFERQKREGQCEALRDLLRLAQEGRRVC